MRLLPKHSLLVKSLIVGALVWGGAALAGPYGPTEMVRPAPSIIPHPTPVIVPDYRQGTIIPSPSVNQAPSVIIHNVATPVLRDPVVAPAPVIASGAGGGTCYHRPVSECTGKVPQCLAEKQIEGSFYLGQAANGWPTINPTYANTDDDRQQRANDCTQDLNRCLQECVQ